MHKENVLKRNKGKNLKQSKEEGQKIDSHIFSYTATSKPLPLSRVRPLPCWGEPAALMYTFVVVFAAEAAFRADPEGEESLQQPSLKLGCMH
jgi:hypothetical protein